MGKLRPKTTRYTETMRDAPSAVPSAIVLDHNTGQTILIIGTREQQITVLRSLNIAEGKL